MKKRFLLMMLAGVMAFSMIGCGGNDAPAEDPNAGDEIVDVEGETEGDVVVEGEGAIDVPERMWLTGKSYPSYYWEGDSVEVDNLVELYHPDRNTDWEFIGWYYDEECTQPVDGAISKDCRGDLTLYGKLNTSEWTPPV